MEHTWNFPDGMNSIDGEVKGVCTVCHTQLFLSATAWQAAIDAQTLDVPEIHQRHLFWWEMHGSKAYSHCPDTTKMKWAHERKPK